MLSLDERKELSSRYYRYFEQFVKIGLSNRPRRLIPTLVFTESDDAFASNGVISIGLKIPVIDLAEDDEEFIMAVLYLLGHEMQHQLSTPDKYWVWGQNAGRRAILQRMSEIEEGKGTRIIRLEKDEENFLAAMRAKGININIKELADLVMFIQNSICDGRIERLRSKKSPGFKNYMLYCRAKRWVLNKAKKFDETDIKESLPAIVNQLLTLATCGLYQKDFIKDNADSKTLELLDNELAPIVKRGVMSPNCKGAMGAAVELEEKLADLILEYVKCSSMDQMLQQLSENSQLSSGSNQNTSNGTGQQGGLKTNEEETEEDDSASSQATSKAPSQSKEASDQGSDDGQSQSESSEAEGECGWGLNSGSKPDGSDSKDSSGKGKSSSSEGCCDAEPASGKADLSNVNKDLSHNSGHQNTGSSAGEIGEDMFDAISENILAAMEAAKEAAAGDISVVRATVPTTPKWAEVKDTSPSVRELGNADAYPEHIKFEEVKRVYDVDTPLPSDLEARASAFDKKVSRLFNNVRKPNVRGHMSGRIDARSVFKLAMRQADFYEKKGVPETFNGCAYLLQDNSGSMGYGRGSKRDYCCEAMSIVEEGFKKHMPLKIVAFDSQGDNHCCHEVIKGFDERLHQNCAHNFFLKGRSGGGNKDGYSIRIATEELLKRSEREKILVVASDGCPSCYPGYSDGLADVKDAIEKARTQGIKVVGIYFADSPSTGEMNDFASMYQYDYVITTPEKIEDELVRVLSNWAFS